MAQSDKLTSKQRYLKRKSALWSERSSWLTDWQDLADYVLPTSGRFFYSEANRGDKIRKSKKVYDSTAKRGLNVLAAGLMAGMTSPARPWFRLSTPDRGLNEKHAVKLWLNQVENLMRDVFAESNVYRSLHQTYTELGGFGTGAMILMPDFDDVIHCYPLTIGEYALATDSKGAVNTLFREFNMTVGQMIEQFGRDKCSNSVRNIADRGNYDQWVPVHHIIEPRKERDASKRDNLNMPFKSVYYELGGESDMLLSESGFKSFPCLAPRWLVTGNDVYGTGPAHDALPDIRQLQHGQLRKQQAIDYQVQPPLQVPSSLKEAGVNRLPGGVQYVDTVGAENSIRTMYEVRLDLSALREDIMDVRERIRGHFYEDLFLMMANDNRSGITATEVAERHEEKLLMLGPVLERLQNELLNPLIDFTFERLVTARAENGQPLLPPAPPEMQGMALDVEYISTLAQAQRAVGLQSIDRLVATVGAIAGAKQDPAIWDKINVDQIVDEYGDGLGISPKLIVSDEDVMAAREARAKQAAQAQALAAAESASKSMANVASAAQGGGMQDVANMFMGYGSPSAVEVGA
jgi:hypothetical protein